MNMHTHYQGDTHTPFERPLAYIHHPQKVNLLLERNKGKEKMTDIIRRELSPRARRNARDKHAQSTSRDKMCIGSQPREKPNEKGQRIALTLADNPDLIIISSAIV
jgi:hypothetical protein